jgi:hypothetical protein
VILQQTRLEATLGAEELETLLHVLGDAAALPGRLAPTWQAERSDPVYLTAIRRTAAHSLLARGLVRRAGTGFEVEPAMAALLAVPTRPAVGFEFDIERGGAVVPGAGCATADDALLVLPRRDGTVLVRGLAPAKLAEAVVEAAGTSRPGPASVDVPRSVLAEPLDSASPAALAERGLDPDRAGTLAGILGARTGSGRAFAIRRDGGDDGAGGTGWLSSPVPVAWWDTTAGRYLVGPGPVGPDNQRLVSIRGCTDTDLRNALAELTA